ncbi:response regulator [Roseomonas nepalensis]|uniref:histidine kinase n=1 Tax=Muricoccus nepalensis TaxID=1854500 RepID=A0A502FR07_9PROT|nr:ATP-binding protein [Roseomonas nepalensis]TPG51850.1 response regulator [Roseomonas nepalensis]
MHNTLPVPERSPRTASKVSPALRFRGLRVSTRLLLIIGACLLPTLALQATVSWSQLTERRAQLGDLAIHQAELLGGNVEGIASGARILLGAASQSNQVRSTGSGCGARLAGLREQAAGYAFIALVEPGGRVACASDAALLAGDPPDWARAAVDATGFGAGRFTRTATHPAGVLPFHLPLPGGRALVAALDLDGLAGQLRTLKRTGSPFLAGGVLTIADAGGTILARDVRHAEFVGRPFPPEAMELVGATAPGLLRLRSIDGAHRLVGYTPPTPANHGLSALAGFSEPELMGDIEHALLRGVLLLAGVSVVVFLLTLLAARRFVTRPTQALLAAAEEWRLGNLAARAPDCGPASEFGQLALAWNSMAAELRQREEELREHAEALERRVESRTRELVEANARLSAEVAERQHTEAALLQAQKVQAVGQLAGGIAHDFNNVLQAVLGGINLIRRRAGDPAAVRRLADMVQDAARRGESVTRRLLAFSRREELRADTLAIGCLLRGLQEVLSATLGSRIRVEVETAPGLPPILADRGQLETVLVNLATNARDAMPGGGTLRLHAGTARHDPAAPEEGAKGLAPGDYVRITVTDTGEGMSPAVLARAAEAFFTTKPLGQGTGLGLAMARSFAQGSGGALSIASAPGEGTSVSLLLPVAAAAAAPAPPGTAAPARRGPDRRPRVLLVDDEPIVREVLSAQLADLGYAVTEAADGNAALAALDAAEPFDILVSDLAMPGLDGVALIREAQRCQPGLPAILVTGYAGEAASLAVGNALGGTFTLLRKPVSGIDLADRVATLLGEPAPRAEAGD